MGEKLSEGPSAVRKTNQLGVLRISKKRGLSINPDINHSKDRSSVNVTSSDPSSVRCTQYPDSFV